MKFAINYSPQAEKLWREGRIQVDLFKCPDWPDLVEKVAGIHHLYVHFSLRAGGGDLDASDLAWAREWLESTETRLINTHFWARKSEYPADEPPTVEAIIERAVRDVEALGERFGVERVVIENVPHPTRALHDDLLTEVADPAVISEVTRRAGCGLLLDIAHAIRACEGTGRGDIRAYLDAMPVNALRELHVVGILPEADENGIRRDHFAMTDADWEIAQWAVEQIGLGRWRAPDTLAFEYGGIGEKFAWRSDETVIAAQAPRLYKLAKSV